MIGPTGWLAAVDIEGLARIWLQTALGGRNARHRSRGCAERKSAAAHRVGWGFIALYTLAFISNCLVFLAPLLVTLALKVNSLVDLALVVDVLPDNDNAAKDLGVFTIAAALPFSVAPGIAPAILAVGGGSYGVLYAVAGVWAIIGAVASCP